MCAPQALAAGYTLNQSNLDAAAATPDNPHEGIFCGDGMDFCVLSEGDWTQEGNIDLSTVEISGTPVQGLILQNNVNISNPDGGTFKGNINITDADEVTLNNLNVTGNVAIQNGSADVTIDGGSYTGEGSGAALNIDNVNTVTVNNATFAAGEASAAYIFGGNIININGGSFTSEGDNGIEVLGFNSLNITSGTFTGAKNGLLFEHIPDGSSVSLSGGTFTGTGANGKAIYSGNTGDTATITNMLLDGYHFTNSTISTEDGLGGGVYIASTTSVVSDSASEEETAGEEAETEAATTAETTSGIGSPDTGAYTAEEGSANSSSILAIMSTVLVALTGAILVKKHSKRA